MTVKKSKKAAPKRLRQYNVEFRPNKAEDFLGYDEGEVEGFIDEAHSAVCILIIGPTGSGKTTLAKMLAKSITGQRNIIEYNAGADTGIDEIRKLVSASNMRTLNGERRVFIVDEVHALSKQAMNAVLKPTESEDPSGALWIFCTNEEARLPQVLRDRALLINTPEWTERDLKRLAKRVSKETGRPIPDDIRQFANPRQLLTYMQMPRESSSVTNKKAATSAKYLLNVLLGNGGDNRKLYDINYSTVMAISLAIREYLGIRIGWEEADPELLKLVRAAAKDDPTKLVAIGRGCANALKDPNLQPMILLDILVGSAILPDHFET